MRIYGKNKKKKYVISENPAGLHLRQPPIMTLEGREALLVTGCRSILVYSCGRISLRLHEMTLNVNGSDLTMKTYYGDRIMIAGEINSMEFEV